ncbi:hypothetical protein HYC85_002399 [Camellia sinensis]|uniref:Uncharacterized protein n=1 Tax=Camellia sinensis TaxID=4442 RepID=A0A7J7I844_CAMSI|nr:hypothetical protein HYC85_002399 [Camellia sinensis]
MGGFTQSLSCLQQEVPTIILSVILHEWKGLLSSVGIVMIRLLKLAVLKLEGELGKFTLEGRGSGNSMFVQSLRGDPFRVSSLGDFQMSILATLTHPSSKSDIIKLCPVLVYLKTPPKMVQMRVTLVNPTFDSTTQKPHACLENPTPVPQHPQPPQLPDTQAPLPSRTTCVCNTFDAEQHRQPLLASPLEPLFLLPPPLILLQQPLALPLGLGLLVLLPRL